MKAYKLTKPLLDLKKGTVFLHVDWNSEVPEWGNIGTGAMVLAWSDGDCQCNWAGGAFVLPGQYAKSEYFGAMKCGDKYTLPKTSPRKQIGFCNKAEICRFYER